MEFKKFETPEKPSRHEYRNMTDEVKSNKITGTKIRLTHVSNVEGAPEDQGWLLICTNHDKAMLFTGQREARDHWHKPWEFCPACAEIKEKGGFKKLKGDIPTEEFKEFLAWKESRQKDTESSDKPAEKAVA